MKNATTFTASAFVSAKQAATQTIAVISVISYLMVLAFALIYRAGQYAYALGVVAGEYYYDSDLPEQIAEQVEPCKQALVLTYEALSPVVISWVSAQWQIVEGELIARLESVLPVAIQTAITAH